MAAQEPEQEIVANLATGRAVIYVAKDGIVIGALEHRIEAETRPPVVLPLGERRVGILLGAVEWVLPASGRQPVRLDRELAGLAGQVIRPGRREPDEASDIEAIGLALLERLRAVTQGLHRKIQLQPEGTLLELILAGYTEDYGAEVWHLRYRIVQEPLRGEYLRTRVLRPSYTQLYPPEKGQPRTLIEVCYPPESPEPALLDLLKQDDPRMARIRNAGEQTADAAARLTGGESHKAQLDDATQFLRAALDAVSAPDAAQTVATLEEQGRFQWVLAPPEPVVAAEETKPREPGAPTLRKKPQ